MKLVNLRKATHCEFGYTYNHGDRVERNTLPDGYTVNGFLIDCNTYARPHHDFPCETELERANRLGMIDVWRPICRVFLVNRSYVNFYGVEAVKVWNAWKGIVYGSK